MAKNKVIPVVDTKPTLDKKAGYEEAFMNILSSTRKDYMRYNFYSFIIAKMQLSINNSVPTAAAGFRDGTYHLIINPAFYNPLPLEHRIGILVHEAMHVILKHIFRKGERNHKLHNIACDVALNQMIDRNFLPEGALYHDTFKTPDGNFYPENLTSEQYYELLKEEKENQEKEKEDQEKDQGDCPKCDGSGEQDKEDSEDQDGSGDQESEDGQGEEGQGSGESEEHSEDAKEPCDCCQGSGKDGGYQPSNGNPDLTGSDEITLDSHDMWDNLSDEEEELAGQMMDKMLEDAMAKAKGDLPGNLQNILELWRRPAKVSWKRLLKKYLSSKTGSRRTTIKRRDRRQPSRMEIKGRKVDYDTPTVIVGIDTSGSMSDAEILGGLVEIDEVCKVTGAALNIVQIDTQIQGMEEYDPKKRTYKRNGYGGTYMGAMAEYVMQNKINYDVLIMISDMYIEDVSTDSNWQKVKKPTLWLNTTEGYDVPWDGLRNHKIIALDKA